MRRWYVIHTAAAWNDGVVERFLRASGFGPGGWTACATLYAAYVEWAPVGVPVLSPVGFGRAMARMVARTRRNGRTFYAVVIRRAPAS
jgi:hypothetical protein